MRFKEIATGDIYVGEQWHPGLDHLAVIRENPPTRGERDGSAEVRCFDGGKFTVQPGCWLLAPEDGSCAAVCVVLDDNLNAIFEKIPDGDDDDAILSCPLLGVGTHPCRREHCAWWVHDEDGHGATGCAVVSVSKALFTPKIGDAV